MMKDAAVDMVVVNAERHTVVLLSGEMDRASAPRVRMRLRDLARRPLVLDVAGVSFFDAEGVRTVSACARECEAHGAALAMVGMRPFAARMFRVLGLEDRIPLCSTTDEALWCVLPRTDAEIGAWLAGN
ncbi:STAS domain-containing protein [Actinomadura graeca]|uniref:Anti-sigma factor antagonist n=1 Tax=Actinomadura graeca TaxID=2750812 RepID=A0ABX8R2T6_9ACTN|nr:STAS domain-containing protein [Actinomadura graeca]QXJ25173.1 STAS domain-containing protein [Actinomadura graeca]